MISYGYILSIAEIMLIDLALCGDNIGVIALATKNLPKSHAKTARMIGILGAVIIRIILAYGVTLALTESNLHIKLFGGILLLKITWDFISANHSNESIRLNSNNRFWKSVFTIVIADVTMSLDNVLAIASAADGDFFLLAFGILFNMPVILLGSRLVVNIMKKYPISIYIGGAMLLHTSFKMIFEDNLTSIIISPLGQLSKVIPWGAALLCIIYGIVHTFSRKTTRYQ